jgi:hypothetical protein
VKIICIDEKFVKVQELAVKEDGTTPKLSSTCVILKDLPQNMLVSTLPIVQ